MRIELQSAYILHSRAYRDTSLIVDLLTPDYGRLSVVSKGGRARKGKSGVRQLLNPFQPLLVSCQGRGDLKTLTTVESAGIPHFYNGRTLYSALYLNELLIRLVAPMDPHPRLFEDYTQVLALLAENVADDSALEPLLRNFEFSLLDELGYGLSFEVDAVTGADIVDADFYDYVPESGFVRRGGAGEIRGREQPLFRGELLQAIASRDFTSAEVRQAAKWITRKALAPLLGSKPLRSRELFQSGLSGSKHM